MDYETHTFEHDGHQLVYDEYGDGDRLVVYLHGLLLDSELNRGVAAALANRGFRVVLLDLLGHGRSGQPAHAAEYRIDSYAEQVVGLLDHLGATQAVLGGMSLGANVSLFVGARHPERVAGLVLEMPVLEWAVPAAAMAFVPLLLGAHYGRRLLTPVSRVFARIPRTPFGPLNSLLDAASFDPRTMASVLHGVLVGPVAPTIDQRSAIEAPTLVLAHAWDLIHPFDDAVNLTHQLPDAELVRATSPLELRALPGRLSGRVADFVDECWNRAEATASTRVSGSRRAAQ